MSDDPNTQLPEQPEAEEITTESPTSPEPGSRWEVLWENLLRMGLGEIALRVGASLTSITLILLVVWVMSNFYLKSAPSGQQSVAAAGPTATSPVDLPEYILPEITDFNNGLVRQANVHTNLPQKSRFEISQYTVLKGDTVFGIAEKFGLKPQTILWGNFDILADDPHRLRPDQVLNILPVDGVLYTWNAGDGLNGVAKFFNVTPEDILNWPGNNLSADTIGDYTNPNIAPGTKLLVPGGQREFVSWSAPRITRDDPATAKVLGPGYCGAVTDGAIGVGTFLWPTTVRTLSGYDYTPETNHWGIDIGGVTGNAIYAVDSGVVVYSGWNDWGYGYVVVIDHGNGWQSLYAHLSEIYVNCGASVVQGGTIAGMGSTGNSSGPHLHFELMNETGYRVNPWNFLQ